MKRVTCLRKALAELQKAANNDLPVQQLTVFLLVAEMPEVSSQEICKHLGMSKASVSRNLAALGKVHRLGKPGLGWVDSVEDPMERRRKVHKVSTKGKKVLEKLLTTIERNQ